MSRDSLSPLPFAHLLKNPSSQHDKDGPMVSIPLNVLAELLNRPKKLYTLEEVAEILQCEKKFLNKFRENGQLIVLKIGSLVRIKEEDLNCFLENHKELSIHDEVLS